MTVILNKNIDLLERGSFALHNVSLNPSTGLLATKDHAYTSVTFIYNKPSNTVASFSLFNELLNSNQAAISCRSDNTESRMHELALYKNKPNYWFTVNTDGGDFRLLDEYCSRHPKAALNICVDTPYGDTIFLHKLYEKYSKQPWCKSLMSGTIYTPESAHSVWDAGCTHIRIGSSDALKTHAATGCGTPSLSTVFQIWLTFREQCLDEYPALIVDNNIKTTGDITKLLAAGADGIILDNLLSKTKESGGWRRNIFYTALNFFTFKLLFKNKRFYKHHNKFHPAYTYLELYNKIVNALRSTIFYTGIKDINDLNPDNVEFIKSPPCANLERRGLDPFH